MNNNSINNSISTLPPFRFCNPIDNPLMRQRTPTRRHNHQHTSIRNKPTQIADSLHNRSISIAKRRSSLPTKFRRNNLTITMSLNALIIRVSRSPASNISSRSIRTQRFPRRLRLNITRNEPSALLRRLQSQRTNLMLRRRVNKRSQPFNRRTCPTNSINLPSPARPSRRSIRQPGIPQVAIYPTLYLRRSGM